MKEGRIKRLIAGLLVFVMTLALCACGNTENIGTGAGGNNANNNASKQYVYSYENIDLGVDLNNVGICGLSYKNDRLYVLLQDYSGQFNMPEEGTTEEGTVEEGTVEEGTGAGVIQPRVAANASVEVAVEDIAVDMPVVEPEEYVYYGPVYVLISSNLDGSDQNVVILDQGDEQVDSSYMNSVEITDDGMIIGVMEEYFEDYSDPDNPIYKNLTYLARWDLDGTLLWKKDMQEFVGEQEYYYPRDILVGADGTISFFSYEGIGASVDADGNLIAPITIDSNAAMYMGSVFQKSDGTVYMTRYNDEYTKMFISTLDIKTGAIGEEQELPGNLMNYSFYSGYNTDFMMTNNLGVYTYNIGDAEPVQIMDYINSDFPSTYINGLAIVDDAHMIGYYSDQTDGWKLSLAYFTKVEPEDVPDKNTILLGCNYLDSEVRRRVISFNKSNPNYRIAIKDYSTYSTMEDYNAGYTQLNNDIISGQMPDILLVNSNMDTENYINKGLLADINELIANDEELSQVEFLDNIMEAFSIDGKLYTLVPSFSINTMIGKKSVLGDRDGWNMDEFMEFAESIPEDTMVFGNDMLRDGFIYQILRYLGNDFIDPKTGKCSFDSPEFIKLLEYAKTFPKEFSEDYWENYDYTLYESMYREDRAFLAECYMSGISDLKYQIKGQFGEEVTFVGFPTAEGNGSIIQPSYTSFAISATTKAMDGAWEFVRYYLTDEFQKSENLYEFPVTKEAFLEDAAKATEKPYWIDQDGNKQEYDDYYYINGEEVVLEPFTQEEVDAICEFIYSVNKVSNFDEDIRTIITEEAQSFFEGQKTAQEVAQIIQSRAQIFIDENR